MADLQTEDLVSPPSSSSSLVSPRSRELPKPRAPPRPHLEGTSPFQRSHADSPGAEASKRVRRWRPPCIRCAQIQGRSLAEARYDGRPGGAPAAKRMRAYAQGKSSRDLKDFRR